ncbi:MAG: GNAT family N-acetyltransferase [Methanomassiliicoccales archaeon]
MRLFSRRQTVLIRRMAEDDIDDVREVGRRAWSDLYSREMQQTFEVPRRSKENILFYLDKEPDGCMVAESGGRVVGDVFCHIWGNVGWFGPVEVLPSQQNNGIGKQLIKSAFDFLKSKGCETIGLETMPEVVKNVHLYTSMGCVPDRATYLFDKTIEDWRYEEGREKGDTTIEDFDTIGFSDALKAVSAISLASHPGLDYSKEVLYSMKHQTGQTFFVMQDKRAVGFALVYTYSTSDGTNNASIRIMLIDREHSTPVIGRSLLAACENYASEQGRDRIHARLYTGNFAAYTLLKDCGYQLRGTNLRMLQTGNIEEDKRIYHLSSWAG